MTQETVNSNTPKNISNYKGQYVVFFSDEKDPKILFNSFIAEEAYLKAEEINKESGRLPIVYRVQEENTNTANMIFR